MEGRLPLSRHMHCLYCDVPHMLMEIPPKSDLAFGAPGCYIYGAGPASTSSMLLYRQH